MSDTLRCYRAVRDQLHQLHARKPTGRLAQTLDTLAWIVTGIVRSESCQLPAIATHMPYAQRESHVKKLSRFMKSEAVEERCSYLSFARLLLRSLAKRLRRFVLVLDGSEVGRDCRALVVSVRFLGRALPVAFVVETGAKGHFSEAAHLALLRAVQSLLPAGVPVTFVADGEFDGVGLLDQLEAWGWEFVCRTARNAQITADGETFPVQAVSVEPGGVVTLSEVGFTEAGYGPVQAVAAWRADQKEPIYLVTNLELGEEALHWYRKRFGIETFFSDQKSRGFDLHKSRLSDPKRLARLMIAACLAYVWLVFLGRTAQTGGWMQRIHRQKRCDLSLFQLGRVLLNHLLLHSLPIPTDFLKPPTYLLQTVRY
jgi:hypothetical protein